MFNIHCVIFLHTASADRHAQARNSATLNVSPPIPGMCLLRQVDSHAGPRGTVGCGVDAGIVVDVGSALSPLVAAVRQTEGLHQVPAVRQRVFVEVQSHWSQRLTHVVVLAAAHHQLGDSQTEGWG